MMPVEAVESTEAVEFLCLSCCAQAIAMIWNILQFDRYENYVFFMADEGFSFMSMTGGNYFPAYIRMLHYYKMSILRERARIDSFD